MIIVREASNIGSHVIHNLSESLKHHIDALTGELSEVLIFSSIRGEQPCLHLIVSTMSYTELLPDLTSQFLPKNTMEFMFTDSAVQEVHRLVVGLEKISRTRQKEALEDTIVCVNHDIPKKLSFPLEKCTHPCSPHLVVLLIEEWRT